MVIVGSSWVLFSVMVWAVSVVLALSCFCLVLQDTYRMMHRNNVIGLALFMVENMISGCVNVQFNSA